MQLPITPFIDLINSIICAFCAFHLYRSWQRNQQRVVLRYFAQAYFVLVLSYLFFSLPRLIVPNNLLFIGIGFVIAQGLLYVAIAYFAKVTTFFLKAQWLQRVFLLVLFISLFAIFINIIFFNIPIYDSVNRIIDWNTHSLVGIASMVIFAGVLIPSAVFFGWQGFQSHDRIVRIRSSIISFGIALLIVTAYIYYTANTYFMALLSDILSLISFLIIFFGVIYRGARLPQNLNK